MQVRGFELGSIKMTLSQRIKELRHKADITLDELSKRSQVAKSTLSRIETGQSLGTTKSLVKLAKAFQMSVQELISEVKFE
ncbi:helix-turn-helix domain-containing protein [Candidatus Omnitrophota bacterium]